MRKPICRTNAAQQTLSGLSLKQTSPEPVSGGNSFGKSLWSSLEEEPMAAVSEATVPNSTISGEEYCFFIRRPLGLVMVVKYLITRAGLRYD